MGRIAPDKWKHFYTGIPLGAILYGVGMYFLHRNVLVAALSAVAVAAIAYGFELFSLITGWGHYDVMDAVASFIGGAVGILLAIGCYFVFFA